MHIVFLFVYVIVKALIGISLSLFWINSLNTKSLLLFVEDTNYSLTVSPIKSGLCSEILQTKSRA